MMISAITKQRTGARTVDHMSGRVIALSSSSEHVCVLTYHKSHDQYRCGECGFIKHFIFPPDDQPIPNKPEYHKGGHVHFTFPYYDQPIGTRSK